MTKKGFSDRLLFGLTGEGRDWKSKLEEINKHKITKIALFLERFKPQERSEIYKALLTSKVKKILMVHLRDDMKRWELVFLTKNFSTKYFTIHPDHFKVLKEWKGFYKRLYLEFGISNKVRKYVNVNKIGGFCVDLSHFKMEKEKYSKEFEYIIKRENVKRYFKCNHLNGYSYKKNSDMHTITSMKEFEYLNTIPNFLLGDVIGMEMENSIKEQLKFKKYLTKMLKKKLRN